MDQIKENLKVKQALKEAEERKRGKLASFASLLHVINCSPVDKIEDAKARAAVKAQIEADRKARAEKAAREKALREGREIVDTPSAPGPAQSAASSSSGVSSKDFKETRLQIRMASGGQPYTITLSSDARRWMVRSYDCITHCLLALREVAEFLAGQTLSVDVESVSFAQHFPR